MKDDAFMETARQEAAQCWCDETTKHIEMDSALAEAIARRLAGWMRLAAQETDGAQYYHGLVVRCGKAIGEKAFICDDGTKVPDVLCAKVPELVEELAFQMRGLEK